MSKTPLSEYARDVLPTAWVRLKAGKCRLKDDSIEAVQAVLLLLVAEAADARATSARIGEANNDARVLAQARYYDNVHGYLKAIYTRFEQKFPTRSIEQMTLLRKQLRESASDV